MITEIAIDNNLLEFDVIKIYSLQELFKYNKYGMIKLHYVETNDKGIITDNYIELPSYVLSKYDGVFNINDNMLKVTVSNDTVIIKLRYSKKIRFKKHIKKGFTTKLSFNKMVEVDGCKYKFKLTSSIFISNEQFIEAKNKLNNKGDENSD